MRAWQKPASASATKNTPASRAEEDKSKLQRVASEIVYESSRVEMHVGRVMDSRAGTGIEELC